MAAPHSDLYAAWYDASDDANVTVDGSNLVSQWVDLSGNARHATQATASLKPRYSAVANGIMPIDNGDTLDIPNVPAKYAFIALSQYFATADLEAVTSGAGTNSSGQIRVLNSREYRATPATAYNNNDFTYQGGRFWVNGELTTNYPGPAVCHVVTAEGPSVWTLTRLLSGPINRDFGGWLHEAIFVDSPLTDAQITAITAYLVGRWTLPAPVASSRPTFRSPFASGSRL